MGLPSKRIDRSLLEPGDHIYSYRNKHIYSHHGIYVGDNKVIHFTRTQDDHQKNHDLTISCKECGLEEPNNKHGGVVKCCLDCFLKGHRLFRFRYGVSSSQFVTNRSGTCSTGTCRHSPDEVVRRATELLHSTEGFGEYDLLHNNCESFAVYCKTGKRLSLQAFSLTNKVITTFEELIRQPISAKNFAKTFSNLVVRHKIDTLRHDIAVHQQDEDYHKDGDNDEDDYYKFGNIKEVCLSYN